MYVNSDGSIRSPYSPQLSGFWDDVKGTLEQAATGAIRGAATSVSQVLSPHQQATTPATSQQASIPGALKESWDTLLTSGAQRFAQVPQVSTALRSEALKQTLPILLMIGGVMYLTLRKR